LRKVDTGIGRKENDRNAAAAAAAARGNARLAGIPGSSRFAAFAQRSANRGRARGEACVTGNEPKAKGCGMRDAAGATRRLRSAIPHGHLRRSCRGLELAIKNDWYVETSSRRRMRDSLGLCNSRATHAITKNTRELLTAPHLLAYWRRSGQPLKLVEDSPMRSHRPTVVRKVGGFLYNAITAAVDANGTSGRSTCSNPECFGVSRIPKRE